jgi:hypothetical protein
MGSTRVLLGGLALLGLLLARRLSPAETPPVVPARAAPDRPVVTAPSAEPLPVSAPEDAVPPDPPADAVGVRAEPEEAPATAEDLLARLRRSGKEEERAELCALLGPHPGPEVRWELLARIGAEAPLVREAAARALWTRRNDLEIREALERLIRLDPVKSVRVAAARALGR